jgi:hypothetical protein
MQKNKNRKGLALGAVFALVASIAVGTSPASADESSAVAFPLTGLQTQTTILGNEVFELGVRFGNNVDSSLRTGTSPSMAHFGLLVTKPAGVTVSAQILGQSGAANSAQAIGVPTVSALATTEFVTSFESSGSPAVKIGLDSRTSLSAAVSITFTPFLDANRNSLRDSGESLGTPITLNFVPWSALGVTVSVAQPTAGDIGATASMTVTANTAVNWAQINGPFVMSISSTADLGVSGTGTASANITGAALGAATGAIVSGTTAAGNYSASYSIATAPYSTAPVVQSLSANVYYGGVLIASSTVLAVTPLGVAGTTLSAVTGANIKFVSANNATARYNSAFALSAFPFSASATTSVAVASQFTVSSFATVDFDADSGVVLNGVTYTSSATFLAAGFTLPAGTTTVAVSTFGQTATGGADTIVFRLTSQLKSNTLTVTFEVAASEVSYVPTAVAGLAGEAKTFALTVEDQWETVPVRTDQRVAASVVLGGSTSATVSGAVTAGAASVTLAPTPATRTGSGVVTFTLQTFNQGTQAWDNTGTPDTAVWNVFTYAAGTDAFTSRTVSVSASISYGVRLSYSSTVVVGIANSFSNVVVTAPGLIIRNADQVSQTASGTLTIAANGQKANLQFTSLKAGTYPVTFTSGTASTTSTVVVQPAAHSAGATMTFDKTSIAAGESTTITGTLLDANGNPVATGNTASIAVSWTGKGLPFGNSTAMQTDADGKFSFQVLVLSGEMGQSAISATYKPAGLTVSTLNVTTVVAVSVGAPVVAPVADQKVNVGSFKGFVALYAKGYAGQKMSAIVAGKWIVVESLDSGFERVVRFTGAGFNITVKIYIDGKQVGSYFMVLTK